MQLCAVAPFAGAWIEIVVRGFSDSLSSVAPFAGAWIEITVKKVGGVYGKVAPFAGAWIEITIFELMNYWTLSSLPSRERGLKLISIYRHQLRRASLPSRERGLKL